MIAGMSDDLRERIKQLEAENEALRAQRADRAWDATVSRAKALARDSGDMWRWNAARIEREAARDGFDATTVEGHREWYRWKYGGSERAAPAPIKPAPENQRKELILAEPAPPAFTDPMHVYLPREVASAQAILRAEAIRAMSSTCRAILQRVRF